MNKGGIEDYNSLINSDDMICLIEVNRDGLLRVSPHVFMIDEFLAVKKAYGEDTLIWFKYIEWVVSPYESNPFNELDDMARRIKVNDVVLNGKYPYIGLTESSFEKELNSYNEKIENLEELMMLSESTDEAEEYQIQMDLLSPPEYIEPNECIEGAIDFYKRCFANYSSSYRSVVVGREALMKIHNFLLDVDLNDRTKSGAYALKPKEVSSELQNLAISQKSLDHLEKNLYKDLKDIKKGNKNLKISSFER